MSMPEHIPVFQIFGVERGALDVEDHPQFPNPRSDLGDIKELARGIARSGSSDTPIVLWQRDPGEPPVLLDGKRRVTAYLRYGHVLEDAGLKLELPCTWWAPAAQNGLTADQEAWAYMIRANSQNTQGRKFLTFEEETSAANRLKRSGLSNGKIGDIMGYSRETIGQLLQCRQTLAPNVRAAVTSKGEKPTAERPLSRTQAIALADRPLDEQQEALEKARSTARKIKENGKPITHKALGTTAPPPKPHTPSTKSIASTSGLEAAKAAARAALAEPPPTPKGQPALDAPMTTVEILEVILELLDQAIEYEPMRSTKPLSTVLLRAKQYGLRLRKELERE